MQLINIHEAKTQFSKLVEIVSHGGEEIIIAKAGKPTARLVPIQRRPFTRKPGALKGKIKIAKDFDAPLPADIQLGFEAGRDSTLYFLSSIRLIFKHFADEIFLFV